MKKVFSFDYATGRYLGPVMLTDADMSPLEPGVYLVPGNCVDIEPSTSDGQFAVWTGNEWELHISPLPEPEVLADPQIAINSAARVYLASTDWYVIRKQETGEAIPADVLELRQKARAAVK
jgi:hypothetical protein